MTIKEQLTQLDKLDDQYIARLNQMDNNTLLALASELCAEAQTEKPEDWHNFNNALHRHFLVIRIIRERMEHGRKND